MPDGRTVLNADPDAARVEWELEFSGLSSVEAGAIGELFTVCEGRLRTFTFLDPFDNLLQWSEQLAAPQWQKDGELTVAPGAADPFGGTAGSEIRGCGSVRQRAEVPSGLRYCLSVWVRSETGTQITLCGSTETGSCELRVSAGAQWRRIEHTVQLEAGEDGIEFGIRLHDPDDTATVYGFQVDAQQGASAYKRTGARCGAYREARFADDALSITTDGPDSHSCRVRVTAAIEA